MFRCLAAEQATGREEIIIRAEERQGRGVEPLWGRRQGARSSDMIFEIFFAFCMEYCITHNLAGLAVSASAQFLLSHKGSPTCQSSPSPLPSPPLESFVLVAHYPNLPRLLLPLHMSSLLA